MFYLKYFSYVTLSHFIFAIPQINLYYTDWVSESDDVLQHTCLYIAIYQQLSDPNLEKIFFCMTELPLKFDIFNKNNHFLKFTFAQLSKENITSQQLYLWSAPIDLIENYQFYLNQLSIKNDSLLETQIFYNCTMPRFGPICQYELDYYNPQYSFLYDLIQNFYYNYEYNSIDLTCYTHLKCNRGPSPACLSWNEICDGEINCLNDGVDEEHCWQLEINECQDNEYRCRNGQCIPQSSYSDGNGPADCLDISDEPSNAMYYTIFCHSNDLPSFSCEDLYLSPHGLPTYQTKRAELLMKAIYSIKNSSVSENCWSAFKCLSKFTDPKSLPCDDFCEYDTCLKIVQNNCPDILYFPNAPVLFGNIYIAYKKTDLQKKNNFSTVPFYICYTTSQYDGFFINTSKIFLNNMTYIHSESFNFSWLFLSDPMMWLDQSLRKYHLPFHYTPEICNRTSMYQCVNSSKCISVHRLMDEITDCPYMDDENIIIVMNDTHLREYFDKTHFKCSKSDNYIRRSRLGDNWCDCGYIDDNWCEDEDKTITYLKQNIVFQHICDGFVDQLVAMISGRNETDETECEQWQCNNIYTRCNGIWNCLNGADESGCRSHPILNCTSKQHLCVSPITNQLICLPIDEANDGNVDCLGATDEPTLCGQWYQQVSNMVMDQLNFYCMNQNVHSCIPTVYLCNGNEECEKGDDEQFCTNQTIENSPNDLSDVKRFLFDYRTPIRSWYIIKFALHESVEDQVKNIETTKTSNLPRIQTSGQYQSRCHRGLDLRVWLNDEKCITNNTCLCPSSYYGDQCQYQNQRISLTITFRALSSSWQTPFEIIISLIDDSDQRIIHSYEQISFLSIRDCKQKFNIYLLYASRPKNSTKNYTIHIDFYEKDSLTYRGSVLLPVQFPFLPVHRLAFSVDIPSSNYKTHSCSNNNQCIHGKCVKYSNNPENLTFCQCDQGWSGRYCTIQHTCTCSLDSLCIGISANNRSICVCPLNKFGPRCFLIDTICQTNNNDSCQHGSQCISNIDYITSNRKFVCICSKGYSGDRCEISDNQLIISFDENIILSKPILIHFIEILLYDDIRLLSSIVRTTTLRAIALRQDSIILYWARPFHLVFIELTNTETYYLTVVQNIYNQSTTINKIINPSDRCPHISELFNETFLQWHLIRRIKYYHLPCQDQLLNLSCFYDEVHLCLCYNFMDQRLTNCFKFDHNMTLDCFGQNECENGGQCLQDNRDCPTRSICICPPCFYGIRCQFSTSGFGLSLDAILGYHIIPNHHLTQQPLIIKISLTLTIIFIVFGFINGILSLITFNNKSVRAVGCGLYLLGSSITTLLTMTIFGLKFFILLFAQMNIIPNRTFLEVQCHSIDFLLRACLCMDQWLNACVALERALTTIKGSSFVREKSKKVAKFIIIILIIVIVGTSIHDPIYRHLINEENDIDDLKRIWCIVKYPQNLEVYNYIIHSFHFFGPFLVNLVSTIILITKISRQQSRVYPQRTYQEILRGQFLQQKHLIISPIILVLLAFPRLFIIFLSKCMKSSDDTWVYLVGYFISFIPSMLTFVVFIVPSKVFRKELRLRIRKYRTFIRQRF